MKFNVQIRDGSWHVVEAESAMALMEALDIPYIWVTSEAGVTFRGSEVVSFREVKS